MYDSCVSRGRFFGRKRSTYARLNTVPVFWGTKRRQKTQLSRRGYSSEGSFASILCGLIFECPIRVLSVYGVTYFYMPLAIYVQERFFPSAFRAMTLLKLYTDQFQNHPSYPPLPLHANPWAFDLFERFWSYSPLCCQFRWSNASLFRGSNLLLKCTYSVINIWQLFGLTID